mmetsp:Transcript_115442/g.333451  ORF Transcript_115442/g.333451 Transcript_115442/m.333451 type:complete len:94 (-) Transcript_115442:405-686(-)
MAHRQIFTFFVELLNMTYGVLAEVVVGRQLQYMSDLVAAQPQAFQVSTKGVTNLIKINLFTCSMHVVVNGLRVLWVAIMNKRQNGGGKCCTLC